MHSIVPTGFKDFKHFNDLKHKDQTQANTPPQEKQQNSLESVKPVGKIHTCAVRSTAQNCALTPEEEGM